MSQVYEVLAISQYEKAGEQKKRFTKVGVAFPLKDGTGFSMRLDAAGTTGEYLLKVKQDRQPVAEW